MLRTRAKEPRQDLSQSSATNLIRGAQLRLTQQANRTAGKSTRPPDLNSAPGLPGANARVWGTSVNSSKHQGNCAVSLQLPREQRLGRRPVCTPNPGQSLMSVWWSIHSSARDQSGAKVSSKRSISYIAVL